MKIIQLIICILFLFVSITIGQVKFEAQLGGSNFLGISLNTAFDIPLSVNGNHFIVPNLGLGILLPGWDIPTCIIHTGLNYQYKKWGLGSEVSGFIKDPFIGKDEFANPDVDMIVYPNANYTLTTNKNWYLRISTGAYFAFSKYFELDKSKMEFEGDVIPGAGLSVGHKF
jgi:hypothetical protein